jgi:GNAT superfamily N-acetyltransferase
MQIQAMMDGGWWMSETACSGILPAKRHEVIFQRDAGSTLKSRSRLWLNPKVDSRSRARIVRGIKIRTASPADTAVIADFNRRLARETEQLALDPEAVRQGVAAVLNDADKGLYFVAEVNDAVVGQLMITYEWSDWRNGNLWWIQSVFVKEEFRGQGVFRTLFRHLEELARSDKGVAGLRLYMHADNETARQTYERLGMKHSNYEVFEMDFVLDRKKQTQR